MFELIKIFRVMKVTRLRQDSQVTHFKTVNLGVFFSCTATLDRDYARYGRRNFVYIVDLNFLYFFLTDTFCKALTCQCGPWLP